MRLHCVIEGINKMINYEKLIIIFLFIIFVSCKESSVSSESKVKIYQVPGCQHEIINILNKSIIDSCFNYTFFDKLEIDFCVKGNCCPDANRFLIRSNIFKDTITISVTDTAANLCKCICNYIIHGEFESLPFDSYFVKCIQKESNDSKILYSQKVFRAH